MVRWFNVLSEKMKASRLEELKLGDLSPKATILANSTYTDMVQKEGESLSPNFRGIISYINPKKNCSQIGWDIA